MRISDWSSDVCSSDLTPMVNLAYKAADGLLLYTSYSEGFKGGGFTHRTLPLPILPGGIPSFDPETVKVYEAGFKLDAFGRRLRLNAAFFNTDYSNLQIDRKSTRLNSSH